ncbi:unnamed protein product [Mortierella alpina]
MRSVIEAARSQSMKDPVAGYIHSMLGQYFDFYESVPAYLNEREGVADITWAIIRGASRLARVESRHLEVPVIGVVERKNAGKNLLMESKDQAHLVDRVAYHKKCKI